MKQRIRLRAPLALTAALLLAPSAWSQNFPNRPITLVLPVTAGSSIDNVTRAIATELSRRLGQPLVVDNKPGASGNIGAAIVAKAPPDGYTVLVTTSSLGMAPSLTRTLPWEPKTAFIPVAGMFSGAMSVAVGAHVPATTLKEFVALAKASPGRYTYATPGSATPHHFGSELLQQSAGIQMLHVPYKGTGGAIVDLLGGRVDVAYFSLGNLLEHHKSGKLRILATSTDARLPQTPDVPTLRELGLRGSEINVWSGLFVPAGTPPAIVQQLERETLEAMKTPAVRALMDAQNVVPLQPGTGEQLARDYLADLERWPGVAARAGVKAE